MASGHELRRRTVKTASTVRHLPTSKTPAVDEASGSKPEFETAVALFFNLSSRCVVR
jgi:adenylate cyclase, class 2